MVQGHCGACRLAKTSDVITMAAPVIGSIGEIRDILRQGRFSELRTVRMRESGWGEPGLGGLFHGPVVVFGDLGYFGQRRPPGSGAAGRDPGPAFEHQSAGHSGPGSASSAGRRGTAVPRGGGQEDGR